MSLSIGTTYKFTLINNAFIGAEQIGKLASICDYNMATYIMDVGQLHVNIFPNLPAGVNRDPKMLQYYVIETSDTTKIVVASQWLSKEPEIITTIIQQYSMQFDTNSRRIEFEQMAADYGFKILSSSNG